MSHVLKDQAFKDMRYPARLWGVAAVMAAILGLSAGAGLWLLFDPSAVGGARPATTAQP